MEILQLLSSLGIIHLAATGIVLILLIFLSKESLRRINNILNILDNGAYHDCPYFITQMKGGRRFYDRKSLNEGGDTDER